MDWQAKYFKDLAGEAEEIDTAAIQLFLNSLNGLDDRSEIEQSENAFAITGTVVALGFAFKDYANSIIAGVLELFEAPCQIGDRIKIEDHYGEVVIYGLRGLRLKILTDDIVSIPHNKLWTQAISNANMGNLETQVVTHFYLDHLVLPQQVRSILYRVAQTDRYTQLQLPIEIIVEEQLWGTLFTLKCYSIDARHEFKYKTDLTIRAKQKFKEYKFSYPKIASVANGGL
ncbi:MAG: mechanosensitive ion channel domain-containing protein [Cyanobacteria bacterium P01_D01_bin.56]